MRPCGKMVFGSRADANAHARYAHNHGSVGNMRAYHCPFCGRWHLTSQTKRDQRRKTRANPRRAA